MYYTTVMIFDGRAEAFKIEEQLKWKFESLPRKAKLVVVLDPNNAGSVTYTNLKEKFAARIGVDFERGDSSKISNYNVDETVDGIIIQLPFPGSEVLIRQINPKKDVDGLRDDSIFMPAAVRAVKHIYSTLDPSPNLGEGSKGRSIIVIGSNGAVGKKLVKVFNCDDIDKDNFDLEKIKNADVIISATGQANLIKSEMVKDGVVAIDLGYPTGDFDPSTALRASLFTPVPGGVGPLTVAMLFQNLLDSMHG